MLERKIHPSIVPVDRQMRELYRTAYTPQSLHSELQQEDEDERVLRGLLRGRGR